MRMQYVLNLEVEAGRVGLSMEVVSGLGVDGGAYSERGT